MHIAERRLFIAMSRLLWAFEIKSALDSNNIKILSDPHKYTQGFLVELKPFSVKITSRSTKRIKWIQRAWRQFLRKLDPLSGQ